MVSSSSSSSRRSSKNRPKNRSVCGVVTFTLAMLLLAQASTVGSQSNNSDVNSDVITPQQIEDAVWRALNISANDTITKDKFADLLHTLGLGQSTNDVSNDTVNDISKCLSADTLFTIYSVNATTGLSVADFQRLCPALVQQQLDHTCVSDQPDDVTAHQPTMAERYGYATLSVAIVTVLALLGLILMPFVRKTLYDKIILTLICLAIGTLLSDACLHLIPESFSMDEGGPGVVEGRLVQTYFYKCLAMLLSIFGFMMVETILASFLGGEGHGHSHGAGDDVIADQLKVKDDEEKCCSEHESSGHVTTNDQLAVVTVPECPNHHDEQIVSNDNTSIDNNKKAALVDVKTPNSKHIQPAAWIILVGDALHNFTDGLAIGAAFSSSLSGGVSTSVAVICHEIPHELGDFAVILNAGMSVRQTAAFNFISALTAFIGLYISLSISYDHEVHTWIFVITAGNFFYIALADMVPAMYSMRSKVKGVMFYVLQISGITVGVGILVLLAIFEDRIQI